MSAHHAGGAVTSGEVDRLAAVATGDQPDPVQHMTDFEVVELAVLRRERIDRRRDHPHAIGRYPVWDVTLP